MGLHTKIEWATASWNPFIGCTKVSPACDNCYAERWAKQYRRDFNKVVRANGTTFNAPKTWAKPERIFMCSLSDFFHASIFRADRDQAIRVMRDAPRHTYMLLTKRPENIKPMLAGTAWSDKLPDNVWVGVTAENQEQADKRVPLLLSVPAKVRFVSCEPLLGPVDLTQYLPAKWVCSGCGYRTNGPVGSCKGYCYDATGKSCDAKPCPKCGKFHYWCGSMASIQWVIAGGESGPKARPTHPEWLRALRDQCAEAGVPFMLKQVGEWAWSIPYHEYEDEPGVYMNESGVVGIGAALKTGDWKGFWRMGKKNTGCKLDGKEHKEIPGVL